MSDERLNHEAIETVVEKNPLEMIRKLPESEDRKQAEHHIQRASHYAHECVERQEAVQG